MCEGWREQKNINTDEEKEVKGKEEEDGNKIEKGDSGGGKKKNENKKSL